MNYPSEIPSGTLVDRRYKVVKTLGQGGFGRTYLVEDTKSFDDPFVLKEFVPQATDEYVVTKSRELFEREAKVLNKLEHKQIPKFFGWFEEAGRLFLVQQFVDGKTYADLLQQRQQQNQSFSEAEVTRLLKELLPVLQYIHANNIIHRDISPDNIMLCRQADKPILIDFGVVNQRTATQVASGAVRAGTTVGKQSFSPSEQIGRGICFPSSDLYALAITAMVLLTGKQPREFFDVSDDQLQWRKYTNVSDNLARIIDKMSSEAAKDRYQSAQEVLNEFKTAPTVIVEPETNTTTEPDSQSRSRLPLIVGGVAAVAVIGSLLSTLTPNISGVCDTLDNCSPEVEFEAEYEEIAARAKPIIAEAASDRNLKTYQWGELTNLKNQLEGVAAELKIIPTDLKITDEVKQTIDDVNSQIKRVEAAMKIEIPGDRQEGNEPGMLFKNPQANN